MRPIEVDGALGTTWMLVRGLRLSTDIHKLLDRREGKSVSEKSNIADRAALELALECVRRGANVAFPVAEKCPYNLVVDSGGKLYRVRAKAAGIHRASGALVVNAQKRIPNTSGRGPSSVAVAYDDSDIDVFAARFADVWYIFSNPAALPASIRRAAGATQLRSDLESAKDAW